MTQDAINKAISLQNQITEAIATRNIHINSVRSVFKELKSTEQTSIAQVLDTIHTPIITDLQAQLAALDGNYVNTATQAPEVSDSTKQ